MPVVKVALEVTKEEAKRILNGDSIFKGLLKNSKNMTIERHLPTVVEKATKQAAKQSSKFRDKGVLIGIGVFVVVAVGAAITIGVVEHKKKKKLIETKRKDCLEIVEGYNVTLNSYVSESVYGTLSFKSIKTFTDYIDAIIKDNNLGNLEIDLSQSEIEALYSIIGKMTVKLANANNYALPNSLSICNNSKKVLTNFEKLEEVKEYLYIQQDIFKKNGEK